MALARLPNGDLVVGGTFTLAGTLVVNHIARWNGSSWSGFGTGITGTVQALEVAPDGTFYAGGSFTLAGGVSATNVARWNGTSWEPLGSGISSATGSPLVYDLELDAAGNLIAGGSFGTAGGIAAPNIAKWNGVSWSALGPGLSVGAFGGNGWVKDVAISSSGTILAGGNFLSAGPYFAVFNGITWQGLGTPPSNQVDSVTILRSGDIVCGGLECRRWNGSTWSTLGTFYAGGFVNPTVEAIVELPDGDLLATGFFTTVGPPFPGLYVSSLARFDNGVWSPVGTGLGGNGAHRAIDNGQGAIYIGGHISVANGMPVNNLVRLATSCPAQSSSLGIGCAGSTNTLVAEALPWIGASFRAKASGLPTNSFVVAVVGFGSVPQAQLPLASLLPPQGQPGCDLLVLPDILNVVLATAGSASFGAFLPNAPSLIGASFYHQMVPFQFDGQGNLVAITSTNALHLVVGHF